MKKRHRWHDVVMSKASLITCIGLLAFAATPCTGQVAADPFAAI
jgi:hypothetical protein